MIKTPFTEDLVTTLAEQNLQWLLKIICLLVAQKRKGGSIPINEAAKKWLEPFNHLEGDIWRHREANTKKLISLRKKAGVRSVPDGFRHSYASYRIRELKSNLDQLAAEMGNSPKELIDSYKKM